MEPLSRRTFLQLSARLSALMGLGACAIPRVAEALEELAGVGAPVLWLQGQSCSGCSISLLDSESVTPFKLLTKYISLGFHQTLSSATGNQAVETANKIIERCGYILIAEGAVPAAMPRACTFGEEPFSAQLLRAARNAKAVLAVGTCGAFGGVPAAENNPTGAIGVPAYLADQGVATATISIPGCPVHPEWLVGVVVHLLKFGIPPLDALGRPKMFFAKSLHDQCPRFADYEREKFAASYGEDGCLFKLGCLGPVTKSDCNVRAWNGVNSCIRAGAPCIGCAAKSFASRAGLPFSTKNIAGVNRDAADE